MILSSTIYSLTFGILLFALQPAAAKPQISHSPLNRVWLERIGRSRSSKRWPMRGGSRESAPLATVTEETEDVNATITDDLNSTLTVGNVSSPKFRIKAFVQQNLPTLPSLSGPKQALQERWNQICANATAFRQRIEQLHVLETLHHHSPVISAVLGMSTLAVLSQKLLRPQGVALPTMYALALLGSSAGFHLFLYFITVGYAMGIALPLAVAMVVYNLRAPSLLPVATNLHTLLTILWGIRFTAFVLWRELVNWPQLHVKVMEVNQMATLPAKLLCWLVYSCFYVALATPCWSRLASGMVVGDKPTWGALGYSGIALQVFGLLLESVADYQKSQYKAQEGQRNDWCHVGLWTFSTHPNYLGEMLFWLGTFLGGATSLYHDGNKWKLGLASVGLTFVVLVLRGAILSLDDKQVRKYGYNLDFVEFRKTHSVVGPIQFSKR